MEFRKGKGTEPTWNRPPLPASFLPVLDSIQETPSRAHWLWVNSFTSLSFPVSLVTSKGLTICSWRSFPTLLLMLWFSLLKETSSLRPLIAQVGGREGRRKEAKGGVEGVFCILRVHRSLGTCLCHSLVERIGHLFKSSPGSGENPQKQKHLCSQFHFYFPSQSMLWDSTSHSQGGEGHPLQRQSFRGRTDHQGLLGDQHLIR